MSRQKNKLTALAVKNAEPGKYSDGGGLILHKTADSGKWIYRYSFAGRRREMGLGSLDDTSLSAARKARDNWYSVLLNDLDPISEREREREEKRLALDRQDPTFEEVANMVFEAKKAGLRGEGERGRWFSPIALHVIPKIGKMRISKIHQTDIRDALAPIWKTKHSTAEKAISRTHIIFRQARLMGHDVDPFTVDAAKHMLGEVSHKVVRSPQLHGKKSRICSTGWTGPARPTVLCGG
jgi:Arm domain-containing DNA-binding protein/integrase-like protein